MNEPENFLSRWSRRKREAEDSSDATPPTDVAAADAAPDGVAPASADAPAATVTGEPGFDLASLPSLESIGADTDLSLFMKPGVPGALRHAALRRAWTSDPAIRDFRGLQENDWDFNAPDGIPGFGSFNSDVEIRELAARLFGTQDEPTEPVPQAVPTDTASEALSPGPDIAPEAPDKIQIGAPTPATAAAHDTAGVAAQQSDEPTEQFATARKHGGALPR